MSKRARRRFHGFELSSQMFMPPTATKKTTTFSIPKPIPIPTKNRHLTKKPIPIPTDCQKSIPQAGL
jgi:hypothetical protein